MGSLEKRGVAFSESTSPQLDDTQRAMAENRLVDLKAEEVKLADEIIQREAFLKDAVEQTLAAEASSTEEFEKLGQATADAAQSAEQLSQSNPTADWEEATLATVESVEEGKKEFDALTESAEKTNEQLESDARAKALEQLNEQLRNISLTADTSKMSITELVRYLQQLNQVKSGIEKAGMPEAESTYYELIIQQISRTQKAISAYKSELNGVKSESDRTSGSVRSLGRSFSSLDKAGTISFSTIKKGFSNLRSHIHKVRSAMDRLSKSFKRSFKHGLTNLTKYVLGFRSLYFLVRKLRNGVKEGLENLVKYNDNMNKTVRGHNLVDDAISDLKTSLLYLKNAWAAAFSPIIITVMPLLTKLIDFLAEAGNAIARFFATLFSSISGVDTAYQAVKVDAGDYADSLDKTSGSAKKAADNQKKLNQELGEYDKLLVIKSKNDDTPNNGTGSGSGGDNGPKAQDMFKTVKAQSNLADAITHAFDTTDFEGLGSRLGERLATAMDQIPWPTIQAKAKQGAEDTANFLNGFLGNTHLWTSSGNTIAQAVNTVSGAIVTFNDTINPVLIGYNASQGLRSFILNTNWGDLGKAIGGFFININKGLKTLLDNFPTQETVDAIIEFIDGLNLPEVVSTAIEFTLSAVITTVKLAGQFLGTAGYDLGLKLVAAVSEVHMDKYTIYDEDGRPTDFIELPIKPTVDWTEHPVLALLFAGSDYSAKILIDVMTGGDFAKVQDLWDNWPEWLSFEGLGENVVKSFQALFEFDWLFGDGSAESGFFGARGIVTWFKEDVLDLESLSVWWNNSFLADWFGEMDPNTGKISKKKSTGGAAGSGVGTGFLAGSPMKLDYDGLVPSSDIQTKIKTAWENIKKFINDPIGTIRTTVENAKKFINEKMNFENVRLNIATKWNEIRDKFAEKLQKIRDKVESAKKFINEKMNFENVRESVAKKWETIKGYFVGDKSYITKIKNAIDKSDFITNLKNLFTDPKGTIKDAINKLLFGYDKQAAKTGWQSTQKVRVKGIVDYFEDSFADIVKFIKNPINTALDNIGEFINTIIRGVNNLTKAINGIKISGTNPFTGKSFSYGMNIPNISEIKMPHLAQGAVIPPNKEFLALLGDQRQGTNIETPLDTMVEAFEKALDSRGSANHEPIVLQLEGRTVAQVVWNEEEKKYKQTGFGLVY